MDGTMRERFESVSDQEIDAEIEEAMTQRRTEFIDARVRVLFFVENQTAKEIAPFLKITVWQVYEALRRLRSSRRGSSR
jgi:DNA-directed RNA polymerase specialized sigma subunit